MTVSSRWMGVGARRAATFLLVLGLTWSSGARALTMEPNPAEWDSILVTYYLELIDVVQGVPDGGTMLVGAIEPSDTTLVFQLRHEGPMVVLVVDPNPLSPSEPHLGAGWIPGEEPDSLADVYEILPHWVSTGVANSSSDLFFVSYADLPLGEPVRTLGFSVVFVPEPTISQLLAFGLLGLTLLQGTREHRSRAA
jgi:hypothetical protein